MRLSTGVPHLNLQEPDEVISIAIQKTEHIGRQDEVVNDHN